ncbi:conserved hypothetical protein [Paecilomyces variotii No. 5]|uniref:Uncharacterized protein n=1 Tax=Byssochlamys spectabilis (strain No. 5 / NBRC 109023) TaxID=1356009 RepID=V5FIP5_BYSSN|nr:conserved hypothetical protein [Paecilomyces variotii No. 5]
MAPLREHQPPQGDSSLTYTPQHCFLATNFTSQEEFCNHALQTVISASHHQEVVYTRVPLAWGEAVFEHLDEKVSARKHFNTETRTLWMRIMPTELHDCHQEWMRDEMSLWQSQGLLTVAEMHYLKPRVGTTIKFQYAPYSGSQKEPDFLLRPNNQRHPVLVIESGWSESIPRLMDDMNLWLLGARGTVMMVIILKWQTISNTNQVRGFAEVYTLNSNGIPIMRQREPIYPVSPTAHAQEIRLTRHMLFGNAISPDRDPNDVLPLKFDCLRVVARDALSLMGLVPA